MHTHNIAQGSDAWHQFRLEHFGASEAAAMLGLSTKVKRNELLRMKKTGTAKEFSDWVQENILDYGHEVEALARPFIEQQIGTDLYPVTCSENLLPDHCGFQLSASCDGLTLDGDIAFEHKQWNATLVACVKAGVLPDNYQPQCQQIMLVTGAKKVIFVVSDGTPEKMVSMEVLPDFEWRLRIVNGWIQFAEDLKKYVPEPVTIEAIGHTPENLPALRIEVTGMVTASNLKEYKEHALAVFKGINRELTTDQHFADAANVVKWCGDVEDRLDAAKQHALSQTASIDELFRTIDDIKAEARRTRLELEKLVDARKIQLRTEIQMGAKNKASDHIAALNERLGKPYMPAIPVDFAGAMKGKRTIDSLRNAVDTELARFKIAANEAADRIQINLTRLREEAVNHAFLFSDAAQIVLKQPDDCAALIKLRISEHTAAEEKREADARERIAEEERVKAEAKVRAEQEAAAAAERTRLAEEDRLNAETKAKADAEAPARQEAAASEPAPSLVQTPAPTPAPTAAAAPSIARVSPFPASTRREIPTDDEIIAVVANAFHVDLGTALGWIRSMDVFQKATVIQMQPVESSQIKAVGHDPATNTLAIEFKPSAGKANGSVYHYKNVSPDQFDEFLHAESIGSYFGQHIKNNADRYPYLKVG